MSLIEWFTMSEFRFIGMSRMVRDTRVELVSSVWKTDILADIRIPPTLKLRRAGPLSVNRGNYNMIAKYRELLIYAPLVSLTVRPNPRNRG